MQDLQTPVETNVQAVRDTMRQLSRFAVFDCKDGKRMDSFEFYASPSGPVVLHTKAEGGKLEHFDVMCSLGRDNKMETLMRELRTLSTMRLTNEAAAREAALAVRARVKATKNEAGFPNDVVPTQCEGYAKQAEEEGELWLAVAWWRIAQGVTLGHNRGARYEEEEYRVRDKIANEYASI